ncbi:MAG: adenosylcobinamide-phosphate synthase CbiB [Lachnospiraceae bacterium]|nr:adenosylcobinamide-phosphate synthase CbiB [Lachnospiraceae bacterium]
MLWCEYFAGSLLAVVFGFAADLIFGDPLTRLHPICLIGNLIAVLEKGIRKIFPKTKAGELFGGCVMALLVIGISTGTPALVLVLAYRVSIYLGVAVEAVMCFFLFAVKSLKKESMNVKKALEKDGLEAGRKAVSRIVGRDTQSLSEKGVIKAAVETVAENFSDGVFAPMFYMMIGGGILGFAYKSINTMDSMVGYKNEKYLYFGRFAAKLDDIVNYIPARLAALLMIASAKISGLDGKMAWKIWNRDRRNHASPNSAQTESAAAGALHVQLAGDAYYFGKLYKKPFIGDDLRSIERADIVRINRLMVTSSVVSLLLMGLVKLLVLVFV